MFKGKGVDEVKNKAEHRRDGMCRFEQDSQGGHMKEIRKYMRALWAGRI